MSGAKVHTIDADRLTQECFRAFEVVDQHAHAYGLSPLTRVGDIDRLWGTVHGGRTFGAKVESLGERMTELVELIDRGRRPVWWKTAQWQGREMARAEQAFVQAQRVHYGHDLTGRDVLELLSGVRAMMAAYDRVLARRHHWMTRLARKGTKKNPGGGGGQPKARHANPQGGPSDARAGLAYVVTHWGHPGQRKTTTQPAANPSFGTYTALGKLKAVVYETNKLGDGLSEYEHEFDAPYPVLAFNAATKKLIIAGGRYTVTARGIVH